MSAVGAATPSGPVRDSRPKGWWGMALFVAAEATLVGTVVGSYVYLGVNTKVWPPAGTPEPAILGPALLTAVLLGSLLPFHAAVVAAQHGLQGRATGLLALATCIQVVYLGGQVHLLEADLSRFTPQASAYASIYYVLLGVAHAHVALGLLFDAWLLARLASRLTRYRLVALESVALYWYVVAALTVVCALHGDLTEAMTRRHLDAMQWFGFLAAPLAWATQLVLAYYLAEAHCEAARLGSEWSPAAIAVTAAAALIALLAECAAAGRLRRGAAHQPRRTRDRRGDGASSPSERWSATPSSSSRSSSAGSRSSRPSLADRHEGGATAALVLALLVPAAGGPGDGAARRRRSSPEPGQRSTPRTARAVTGRAARDPTPGGRGVADIQGLGPSLQHAGRCGRDFYLRTGYMPLASPHEQPERSHVLFTDSQLDALIAYVASLGHGPVIPKPDPSQGSLSAGLRTVHRPLRRLPPESRPRAGTSPVRACRRSSRRRTSRSRRQSGPAHM